MSARDLLFEIGVEEMPASYIPPALEQIEKKARVGLTELRLGFGDVVTYATPRRLTLIVRGLAERQAEREEEATGPSVKAAYDAEGKPTRALLGFCQGKGVDPSVVRRVATPKGEYVAVTVKLPARATLEVLHDWLPTVATSIRSPKEMRWLTDRNATFARPVRWLVALYGDDVVPIAPTYELQSRRESHGHRFLAPSEVPIPSASHYLDTLRKVHVIADHRERAAMIERQIADCARGLGGRVVDDPELVEIDNFLVELPHAFEGRFDAKYLDLPREVIVTALREHQRFFAVEDAAGKLLPAFIAVRNGDAQGLEQVRQGNQDVLIARLEDARFYWETDLAHPPASRVDALQGVVWMEGLGSLRDKATRLESLAGWLAERLAPSAAGHARRAALLCKTDLLGEMIGSGKEYASLEGVIGGYYARRAGEPAEVATAIAEHYRPRGSSDGLPASEAGAMLALADKLDHVAGAFVGGKIPSGSEDPYGVRRAGNGVVRIVMEQGRHLDFYAAAMESTRILFANDPNLPHAAIMKQLGEFWRGRVEAALDALEVAYDTRDASVEARIAVAGPDGRAVRRPGWNDPCDALARARVLAEFRNDPRFESLAILFKRVANILKAAPEKLTGALDRARLVEPAERELLAALERARSATEPLWERRAYAEILPALLAMEQAIHAFFDQVLVNAEDPAVRLNRLQLLADVRDLFVRGWDLSRVVVAAAAEPAATQPAR